MSISLTLGYFVLIVAIALLRSISHPACVVSQGWWCPTKTIRSGALGLCAHGVVMGMFHTGSAGLAHFSMYEYFWVLPSHFAESMPANLMKGVDAPPGCIPLNH